MITLIYVLVVLVLLLAYHTSNRKRRPPGPKGLPIAGNIFDFPSTKHWFPLTELGQKYGPIIRHTLFMDTVITLNRGSDANELLNKRSAIYSSRPPSIYAGKHQSQGRRLLLLPYGEELKKHRAAFFQMLQPRVIGGYEKYQDSGSIQLLYDILTKPQDPFINAQRYSGALAFRLTYGIEAGTDKGDRDLKACLFTIGGIVNEVQPGTHLVNSLRILDLLPDIFAPWRLRALAAHEAESRVYGRLAGDVKKRLEMGDYSESFVSRLWQEQQKLGLDDMTIAYLGGSSMEAGIGTTSSQIMWFYAAALLYPSCVKRAQEELDSVFGDRVDSHALPELGDFPQLPYCAALVREIFRWAPSIPGGVPRVASQADVYDGYHIDKGSVIFPNIWGMQNDEELFSDPDKFEPMRFFQDDSKSPLKFDILLEGHWAFGFGRRICLGRHLGIRSVWLAIVRLIWAFDIVPAVDENGVPILPEDRTKCTPGLTCDPEVFPVHFIPRSEKHAETIRLRKKGTLA